jgi:hypothetical protein
VIARARSRRTMTILICKRPNCRHLRAGRLSRALTLLLVVAQVLMAIPTVATASSAMPPAPLAPRVTVNRTVPTVTPPPAEPQFSASPTVAEITRARVFSEPLVPVGGEPTAGENLVLARALLTFHRSGGSEWRSTIGDFLLTHPESPWRAGLLLNVGRLQVREHAYSRALETFNRAWILSKDSTTPLGTAVADMAVSEWMALAARQGRVEEVNARVTEIQPRRIGGSAAVRIAEAQETLALIAPILRLPRN